MAAKRRRLIFFSYLEGMCFALMVATSESLALFTFMKQGLSYVQLALITTLPLLVGSVAQWRIPGRVPNHYLRLAILVAMGVQLLGILCLWGAAQQFYFLLLLSGLCLYWAGGLCSSPLWLDWFASRVSYREFPRIIARRSGFINVTTLVCYLTVAHVSQISPSFDISVIFLVGAIARIGSMAIQVITSYVIAPRLGEETNAHGVAPAEDRLKPLNGVDLLKILRVFFLWAGIFKLAVFVSSPFFLPYMVEQRGFTMWNYCVVTGMALLGRSLFLGIWARAAVGIMPFIGLQFCGLGISAIPILWTASNSVYAAALLEFASGIFWGGFELCAILMVQNFISDAPRRFLGLQMAIMNAAAVVGSLMGSFLLNLQASYHLVFALSSLLRFSIVVFLIFYLAKWPMLRLTVYGINGYLTTALTFRPALAFRLLFPKRRM